LFLIFLLEKAVFWGVKWPLLRGKRLFLA